jgi:hypothetical protein
VTSKRVCKDCVAEHKAASDEWFACALPTDPFELNEWYGKNPMPKLPQRDAKYPGPRCATHHRVESKRVKAAAHDRKVQVTYGLDPGEYEQLYAFQGGKCAICRRATGRTKRLAVDHDHKTGLPRGLLCGPCNQMLGHGRDEKEFFRRFIDYLSMPPHTEMWWLAAGGRKSLVYTMLNPTEFIWMHDEMVCEAPCAVHRPSSHHMVTWRLEQNGRGELERICPHGVRHTDPDDLAYRRRHGKPYAKLHTYCLTCEKEAEEQG